MALPVAKLTPPSVQSLWTYDALTGYAYLNSTHSAAIDLAMELGGAMTRTEQEVTMDMDMVVETRVRKDLDS